MKKSKILIWSIVNSLGAFLYISAVAWLMFNAGKIFGKMTNFWGPAALLLLFVLSATIVGLLVLGKPAYLYFNGLKKEGIVLLLYTIGFLVLATIALFAILLFWK